MRQFRAGAWRAGGVGCAPRERAEDQDADDQVGGLAVEAVAPRDDVRQRLQHHLEFVGAAAAEAREMGRLAPLLACGNKNRSEVDQHTAAGGSLTSDQIVGANKLRLSELDGEIIAQLFAVDGYDDVVLLQVLAHTAPTP